MLSVTSDLSLVNDLQKNPAYECVILILRLIFMTIIATLELSDPNSLSDFYTPITYRPYTHL